jgi:hypothetical protein
MGHIKDNKKYYCSYLTMIYFHKGVKSNKNLLYCNDVEKLKKIINSSFMYRKLNLMVSIHLFDSRKEILL